MSMPLKEIWRIVPNTGDNYFVSDIGRIKTKDNRILKQSDRNGYKRIAITFLSGRKSIPVHRLVAMAFLPNPDNLPEVNHKDEDKSNNRVCNLEWCSHQYNVRYGTQIQRANKKRSKPVLQIGIDGTIVKKHNSIADASRSVNGKMTHTGKICECCQNKRKSVYGYKWQYAN